MSSTSGEFLPKSGCCARHDGTTTRVHLIFLVCNAHRQSRVGKVVPVMHQSLHTALNLELAEWLAIRPLRDPATSCLPYLRAGNCMHVDCMTLAAGHAACRVMNKDIMADEHVSACQRCLLQQQPTAAAAVFGDSGPLRSSREATTSIAAAAIDEPIS